MFFGIPIEILSGLGSYLLSGWLSINKARADREELRHRYDMAMFAATNKANLKWLEAQDRLVVNDSHFSITRRFIALFVVTAVFGSLLLLPGLFQDVPWILQIKEVSDGFLGFFSTESISYETIKGFLYLEWMGSAVMSIIGFYFGNRAGR